MLCEAVTPGCRPPPLDAASGILLIVWIYLIVLSLSVVISLYGQYRQIKPILDKLGGLRNFSLKG